MRRSMRGLLRARGEGFVCRAAHYPGGGVDGLHSRHTQARKPPWIGGNIAQRTDGAAGDRATRFACWEMVGLELTFSKGDHSPAEERRRTPSSHDDDVPTDCLVHTSPSPRKYGGSGLPFSAYKQKNNHREQTQEA